MRAIAEQMHPGVRANDGLHQTLVVRSFRYDASFYGGCYILLGRPCNSDFLAVRIGTSSGNYQQAIAGNGDPFQRLYRVKRTVRPLLVLVRFEGGKNRTLD